MENGKTFLVGFDHTVASGSTRIDGFTTTPVFTTDGSYSEVLTSNATFMTLRSHVSGVGTFDNVSVIEVDALGNPVNVLDGGVRISTTNNLLNSATPATQTTASLGTGWYSLLTWGNTGSCAVTAGTATIGAPTGAASEGVPAYFEITGAGTVTVTETGTVDKFQLQGGIVTHEQTAFIETTSGAVQLNPNVVESVLWSYGGRYSNLATAEQNYLPHVLSELGRTNELFNSDSPATQTTASLITGDYVLWQNGAGSSDLTAGTATISTTGSATDGSPLTFTVTGAGTVTVTIVGGPPDEFQLEEGSVPTTFILTEGGSVQRNATSFLATPTPAAFLRLRFADVVSQNYLTSGTIVISYNGTTLTWTDGTNAMTHVVAMKPGDFAAVEEATGKLYYNGSLVDTNGSYDPTWGEVALGNAVDYYFDDDLDPTDTTWSQP
jgi:hypothetical protein